MPKVKWGVNADDVEGASDGYQDYLGPVPPKGVYCFNVKQMKFKESSNGNPMVSILLILDGSTKPEHKKYDGCPVWTNVVATKEAAWKVKQLCNALGVTPREFAAKTVMDEDDNITKIGSLKITSDLIIWASTKIGKWNDEKRAEINTLMAPPDHDDDDDDDGDDVDVDEEDADEDDDDEGGEPPF